MSRNSLPEVNFETGLRLLRCTPGLAGCQPKLRSDWQIIGRIADGTPFLLEYNQAVTRWTCETNLGEAIRKKILGKLREELRYSKELPDYIVTHDITSLDEESIDKGAMEAGKIVAAFFRDVWRNAYLNDRDEDYVTLAVPFAEKDQAKALGAKWNGAEKTWKIKKQDDMSAFQRWLPEETPAENPGLG